MNRNDLNETPLTTSAEEERAGMGALLRTGRYIELGGVRVPAYISPDTNDERFKGSDLLIAMAKTVNSTREITRRAKFMTTDFDQASQVLETAEKRFALALNNFNDLHTNFCAGAKKTAGEVKDASEKIAQGISRIEKAADFDRLERYVTLLERAALAMKSLAEIQASGKLEKIAAAIR